MTSEIEGQLYLVHLGSDKFKIGQTHNLYRRMRAYKGNRILLTLPCNDVQKLIDLEKKIINIFNKKFDLYEGREFFKGNQSEMINIIINLYYNIEYYDNIEYNKDIENKNKEIEQRQQEQQLNKENEKKLKNQEKLNKKKQKEEREKEERLKKQEERLKKQEKRLEDERLIEIEKRLEEKEKLNSFFNECIIVEMSALFYLNDAFRIYKDWHKENYAGTGQKPEKKDKLSEYLTKRLGKEYDPTQSTHKPANYKQNGTCWLGYKLSSIDNSNSPMKPNGFIVDVDELDAQN